MFNSPVLDIAIVLCFTYFIGSIIVTSLNEFILSMMSKRGKVLKQALETLFFDTDWKAFAENTIFNSVHIASLKKNEKSFPSYIPATNFVSAFMDGIRTFTKTNEPLTIDKIKEVLYDKSNNMPESMRASLVSMFERAENDLEKFKEEIEHFYNNTMDRVSGWYKRIVSRWILVFSFLIAGVLNIDTIHIVQKLQGNPDLEKIADGIIEKTKTANFPAQDTLQLNTVIKAKQLLTTVQIPIGWDDNQKKNCVSGLDWCLRLTGWGLTTLAIMLGAPFWFDLLSRFVNIRGAGKKPEDSKPAGDKYLKDGVK